MLLPQPMLTAPVAAAAGVCVLRGADRRGRVRGALLQRRALKRAPHCRARVAGGARETQCVPLCRRRLVSATCRCPPSHARAAWLRRLLSDSRYGADHVFVASDAPLDAEVR
jgi:hypothetical protein